MAAGSLVQPLRIANYVQWDAPDSDCADVGLGGNVGDAGQGQSRRLPAA